MYTYKVTPFVIWFLAMRIAYYMTRLTEMDRKGYPVTSLLYRKMHESLMAHKDYAFHRKCNGPVGELVGALLRCHPRVVRRLFFADLAVAPSPLAIKIHRDIFRQ